jgi:hypothetical protein
MGRKKSSNYWLFGRNSRLSNTPEEDYKTSGVYQDSTKLHVLVASVKY